MKRLILIGCLLVSSVFAGKSYDDLEFEDIKESREEKSVFINPYIGKVIKNDTTYVFGVKSGVWCGHLGFYFDTSIYEDFESNKDFVVTDGSNTRCITCRGIDSPISMSICVAYRFETNRVQPYIGVGPTLVYIKNKNSIKIHDDYKCVYYSTNAQDEIINISLGANIDFGFKWIFYKNNMFGANIDISGRVSMVPFDNKYIFNNNKIIRNIKNRLIFTTFGCFGIQF